MRWMKDSLNWLVSRNKGIDMRRRLLFVQPGRLGITQEFVTTDQHDSILATAHYWFASLVTVRGGSLGFCDARGLRRMNAERFLLYLPAGALVRMPLFAAQVETIGITASATPPGWPEFALAIPCDLAPEDTLTESGLSSVLRSVPGDSHRIDAECGLPARMRSLRRHLYARALGPTPVGRVAMEHGLSLSVLSRTFNSAFGLSPRAYCQRVRVHAAAVSLFSGLSIAHVALDSGWQDLSRFYRQFRSATGETPGRYRSAGEARRMVK